MGQLSALDASFFAIETENNYGHVGGLSILARRTRTTRWSG
jgi:hypothetical protein